MSNERVKISYEPGAEDEELSLQYAAGAMPAVVDRVNAVQSKDKEEFEPGQSPNYYQLIVEFKALSDPNNPKSRVPMGIPMFVRLPLAPPHWKNLPDDIRNGHLLGIQEECFRKAVSFLRAVCPEMLPARPRRENGVNTLNGVPCSADEAKAAEAAFKTAAKQACVELFNTGGKAILGRPCYITTSFDREGGGTSCWNVYADHPKDRDGNLKPLLTGAQCFVTPAQREAIQAGKTETASSESETESVDTEEESGRGRRRRTG